jgi:hypothetical protein
MRPGRLATLWAAMCASIVVSMARASEQSLLLAEDPLDRLGGQDLREGQALLPAKRFRNGIQSVVVSRSTSGYGHHVQALPGFVGPPSRGGHKRDIGQGRPKPLYPSGNAGTISSRRTEIETNLVMRDKSAQRVRAAQAENARQCHSCRMPYSQRHKMAKPYTPKPENKTMGQVSRPGGQAHRFSRLKIARDARLRSGFR